MVNLPQATVTTARLSSAITPAALAVMEPVPPAMRHSPSTASWASSARARR